VLDLNGTVPGAIQRQVTTVASLFYYLSWQSQANPIVADGRQQYHAEVLWNGRAVFGWSSAWQPSPPLERYGVYVTGTGNDTLAFRSLADGNGGYLLDDISLTQVPEPTITTLIILGLASLIFLNNPRRSEPRISAGPSDHLPDSKIYSLQG
jgi:hypothetical protein